MSVSLTTFFFGRPSCATFLSFCLFLPLLFLYVSRIYFKFSSKKMQELPEAGLMNFLLLFLVLARQVELEDVASRACELLGFLPSNCPPGHRTLIWRGQLSLLLLFQVLFVNQKLYLGVYCCKPGIQQRLFFMYKFHHFKIL